MNAASVGVETPKRKLGTNFFPQFSCQMKEFGKNSWVLQNLCEVYVREIPYLPPTHNQLHSHYFHLAILDSFIRVARSLAFLPLSVGTGRGRPRWRVASSWVIIHWIYPPQNAGSSPPWWRETSCFLGDFGGPQDSPAVATVTKHFLIMGWSSQQIPIQHSSKLPVRRIGL